MLASAERAGLMWPTAFALAALAVLVGARHLAAAAQAVEGRPDRQDRRARQGRARPARPRRGRCLARRRRRRVPARRGARPLPPRQGALPLCARQVGPRLARLYAARTGAPAASSGSTAASCPTRARTRRAGARDAAGRGRGARPRAHAAAAGPLHARQRCGPQSLVLAGRGGHDASAFGGTRDRALPFTVDADARPDPPGGLPRGGTTRIDLPNRHLEYALTWYGLALTLIGVYMPSPRAGSGRRSVL